ncbi:PAS domain-containing sensor histidine kinase [Arcobacter arenosus]|uniref:histidine kinase n=1 Tax=Arcobacter arenosus TaxID=2576037 RepID=A0A5R8XXK1_9BACT|nr:PAS domain-containing sensor histidine kinase [Arcobacter arenosus]TLP36152.1 PAS domain S-box protein [Arcobacter arenosus]
MNTSVKSLVKIFFSLFIIFVFIQIGISYFYFKQSKKNLINNSLKSELKIKRKIFIEHFITNSSNFLFSIQDSQAFQKFLQGDNTYLKENENIFLALAKSHKYIDQVRYIDENGYENIRIDQDRKINTTTVVRSEQLQNKANRYYFEESLYKPMNKVWFSKLDLNVENGEIEFPYVPTIRAILPLEKNNDFKGILIINFNISSLLKQITFSEKFNYILTNKKSEILIHYNDEYDWSEYSNNGVKLDKFITKDKNEIITNFEFSNPNFSSIYICNQIKDSLILVGSIKDEYLKNLEKEHIQRGVLIIISILLIFLIIFTFTKVRLTEILNKLKKADEINEELSENLEISEENWRSAIENSGDGHWEWNTSTNEIHFSNNWKTMLGYEEDEISNNFFEWEKRVHKDDIKRVLKEVDKFVKQKDYKYKVKFRMETKDGSYKWIFAQGYILRKDKEGNPLRIVGTHKDITTDIKNEQFLKDEVKRKTDENFKQFQLIQQQSKLAAMGEMIGAIAHQWRQPLNEISIRIQKLKYAYKKNEIDEEFIQDFINKNKITINFMSNTIDDFRNFFTIDKKPIRFSINESIKNVLNLTEAQLKKQNIKISLNEYQDFEINGYKSEFEHVIMNFISNSKYELEEKKIENPEIIINIKEYELEFEDNAGGIPKDLITRIFEPYFTSKDQGKGTGMGLYMSKMIIEDNMKGSIEVENTQKGAKFIIRFNKEGEKY